MSRIFARYVCLHIKVIKLNVISPLARLNAFSMMQTEFKRYQIENITDRLIALF